MTVTLLALLLAHACVPEPSSSPSLLFALLLEFHSEIPNQIRLCIRDKFFDFWRIDYKWALFRHTVPANY